MNIVRLGMSLILCGIVLCSAAPGHAAAPDGFEPDDAPGLARPLAFGDPPQRHTFHDFGDEDWIAFQAEEGAAYGIAAAGPGPHCDPVLELYDSDGSTLLDAADVYYGSVAESIGWFSPDHSGTYYIRVRNYNRSSFGDGTDYEVSISPGSFPYMPQGRVTGIVTDARTGTPVEGVHLSTDYSKDAVATTDAAGVYDIWEFEGTSTLQAWHRDYATFTAPVKFDGFITGLVDIALQPLEPPVFDVRASGDTVTIALEPGGRTGETADWWLVAANSLGELRYLDLATLSWRPWQADGMPLTIQIPLAAFPAFDVAQFPGFPRGGQYLSVYFGADMLPNGTLDPERLYLGSVTIPGP